jgi:hypothetical protein
MVDLFLERLAPPTQMTVKIDPPKVTETDRVGEVFVREIQAGFLLRADVAHAIGTWLLTKAKEAGFSGAANVS